MKSLLYVFILITGCSQVLSENIDIKLHNKCLYPTVQITEDKEGGNKDGGSGVVIKSEKVGDKLYNNIVLTCNHVYKSGMIVRLPIYNNSDLKGYAEFECVPLKNSVDYDFCLLLFESDYEVPVVEIDYNYKPYIGSNVFKIGAGLLQESRLDYGQITALKFHNVSFAKPKVRINALTVGGDSGSGCFGKESYKMVGIVEGMVILNLHSAHSHIGLISPVSDLVDWNKELSNELDFAFKKDVKIPFTFEFMKQKVAKENNRKEIERLDNEIKILEIIKKALEDNIEEDTDNSQEVAPLPPE